MRHRQSGNSPSTLRALNVDLLSLSGHKLYGPKGIGALYISRQCPVGLGPLIFGGAQQKGLRAGTVPTFLCVGLGEACRIAEAEIETDQAQGLELRELFLSVLRERFDDLIINGDLRHRLPGNLNFQIPGLDADALLFALQGRIAASTRSACNAGSMESSHVLQALGLSHEAIAASLRVGFGRFSTAEDIQTAAELLADKAAHLRCIAADR